MHYPLYNPDTSDTDTLCWGKGPNDTLALTDICHMVHEHKFTPDTSATDTLCSPSLKVMMYI